MTFALFAGTSLLFRLLGARGVRRFATWPVSAAHGLAVMLVATASAHFAPDGLGFMPGHGSLTAMVPPFVPFPSLVVWVTGVLELAGALGLVVARTRRAAGWCLAALFVCLLPANVHAVAADVALGGQAPPPLWARLPEQAVYIAVAVAAARWRTASTVRTVSR
ncbi:hypothetical protein ABJI51_06560 [Amycolatopsis sp. NEAU-NG30]|uniref:DoxX family membrane protein n=1 Tax=Amycolatopsis melonis TaxID=3156488 RepID=A0ABV0L8X8_9PSEU